MMLDAHNLFSDAQVLTTGSENGIVSTNVIDFGVARDIGVGENLFLVVQVDTATTDTGSNSTLEVRTQADDNEGFNSATNTALIGTFAVNSAIGTRIVKRVDPGMFSERYGRLQYLATNGPLATGAVTAYLSKDVDLYTKYNDSITIS